jgi:hypothetical protein
VAAEKSKLVNGGFYTPVGELSDSTLDKDVKSEKVTEELWEWTEKALSPHVSQA